MQAFSTFEPDYKTFGHNVKKQLVMFITRFNFMGGNNSEEVLIMTEQDKMKTLEFTKNKGRYVIIDNPERLARFEAEYKAASAKCRPLHFPRTNCGAITKTQAVSFIKQSVEAREFDSVLSAADLAGVDLVFIPSSAPDGFTLLVDPQPFTVDNCHAELVIGECYVGSKWCWEVVAKKYGAMVLSSMVRETKTAFMQRAKQLPHTEAQWQNAIVKIEASYKIQAECREEFKAFAYAGWV